MTTIIKPIPTPYDMYGATTVSDLYSDRIVSDKVVTHYNSIETKPALRQAIIDQIKEEVSVGRITVTETEDSMHIYTRSQKGLQATKELFRKLDAENPEFKLLFRVIQSDKSIILKYRRHRVK